MATNDMATKSENADIRELQTEMVNINKTFSEFRDNEFKEVKDGVKAIITSLGESDNRYATKAELRTFKLLTIPAIVIVTAIIGGLVTFFFTHLTTANNPTTSSTTTVNTPGGSTSTTSTKDGTPSSSATATSHSDTATPSDSQTSNGGVTLTVPKVTP